jgi:DNA-binding response OmpR family regulator
MSLQGKRVLLVEDDALLMMSLMDTMEEFGCEVVGSATAVHQAFEMARDLPIDFAVLDVNLGGKLVTPVAEVLAARGIPFIFATGYDASIVLSLADRPRVPKPYGATELRTALTQIVRAR